MRLVSVLRLRLRSLFSRGRVERELDEEIRYHLERQIDEDIAAGVDPDDARRAALRASKDFERRKEECRDMRGLNLFDNLLQDFRFAIRQLRKNPGFTSTAVLMLALGMCASVSIFAFVDAALIKPLPYRESSRLVGVYEQVALIPQSNLSYLDYLDWKRLNQVFSSLEAYKHTGFILSAPEGAEPARGTRVSAGFFGTLGVSPLLGRTFSAGEDLPAAPRTALLSYAAWQKRYAGSPGVIGRTVTLDDTAHTIIGVLPSDFHFAPAEPAEFWTTLNPTGSCERRRSCHNLYGIARLKDGTSLEAASANMASIAKLLEEQYPDSNRGQGASLIPLADVIAGRVRPLLLVLLGGSGMLLLIACVNIASLLLVRTESRRREFAVRAALGAARARLIRQFATEGLVLVAAGCALGLMSALWAMRLLITLIPTQMTAGMPYLHDVGLNARLAAYAGVISLLATALFSLIPAAHLSLTKERKGLTEGSRGSAGLTWRRLGSKLVVLELAAATVLLVGAGLFGKSLYRLLRVDLGFAPDHLAVMEVGAPTSRYAGDERAVALGREIIDSVGSLPGVKSVAVTSRPPTSGNGNTDWIRFEGRPYNGEHNEVNQRDVSSAYFTTLQTKLLRGRFFTDAEDASKPRVVVINQALARQYFPGEDPIGKRFGDTELTPKSLKQIVGVVDDLRESSLDVETWPAVYYPFNQSPDTYFTLVVRTSQSEGAILPALMTTLRKIDPGIVAAGGATMTDLINDSPTAYLHRSSAWLVGGFAAAALLLAVIGLYGVITYSVGQRAREIGVRIALGAQTGRVYWLIMGEAGRLIALGSVIGLICSLAAATLIRSLLFGVESWDLPTLTLVVVVLGASGLLASYLPARRAASIDPVEALRAD